MIQLHDIRKSFGSLEVLKGIDLTIGKGEVVSIVGPSGAGKTTLLQIIGTLDRPDSGRVLFDGVDVSAYKEKQLSAFRNSHIGFVFQFHQLLPEFSAVENVMMPALIQGASMNDARRRAMEMLEYLRLTDRATHKPAELSGGEKQRVAVARALVNRYPQQGGATSSLLRPSQRAGADLHHRHPRRDIGRHYRPNYSPPRWFSSRWTIINEKKVKIICFVNEVSLHLH